MRLIDADAFEVEMQHEWENNNISNGEWMDIREWLRDAPTIEAEPVVKCKECKYWVVSKIKGGLGYHLCNNVRLGDRGIIAFADDYCSRGKKNE